MENPSQPFSIEQLPWSDAEESLVCPLCHSSLIVTDSCSGEEVCTNCGCVTNDLVLHRGKDYKAFERDESNDGRRHGAWLRQSIHDKGISTVIVGTRDASGTPLDGETLTKMSRLRNRDTRVKMNETEARNLSIAMAELDRITTTIHLPFSAKECAANLYRKALGMDLIRGRSIDSFVAASVYAACRLLSIPRSLKVVAEESKREYQEVSMTYRFMLRELHIKPPIDEPIKYIPRLAAMLGMSRPAEKRAMDILIDAKSTKAIVGKDPKSVAAAAIYMAATEYGEHLTQRVIAEAASTTEVTLRTRYRDLETALRRKQ